jgi:hypothetical protein
MRWQHLGRLNLLHLLLHHSVFLAHALKFLSHILLLVSYGIFAVTQLRLELIEHNIRWLDQLDTRSSRIVR